MSPNYVRMFLIFGVSYSLVFGIGKDFEFMLRIVTDNELCQPDDFKKNFTHQHFHCVIHNLSILGKHHHPKSSLPLFD